VSYNVQVLFHKFPTTVAASCPLTIPTALVTIKLYILLEEAENLVEVCICCYAYSALLFIKNPTEIRTGLVCRSSVVIQDIRLPFSVIRKLTICIIPSGHLNVFTECLEEFFFPMPPHVLCGLRGPPSWTW
jgi:hypothetical protein